MFGKTPLALLVPALTAGALATTCVRADDTGDAPDGYGLAAHGIVERGPRLGAVAGDDNAPVASLGADGDDIAGGDDEDGVFAFPTLVQNGKAYTSNVFASNPLNRAATLRGWVDFDGDGAFQADEAAMVVVPGGTDGARFELRWTDLSGVTSDFTGETYARFRITGDPLVAADATGFKTDGEVEDYALVVEPDADEDEIPNDVDVDDDNDGIPDTVEVIGTDTDGDGRPDYLDGDSDGDGVADFAEAGPNPGSPVDTDGDGVPDYLDTDSNDDGTPDGTADANDADGDGASAGEEGEGDADGDGIPNDEDVDADNDGLHDSIELGGGRVDTDGDGTPDFLDLDSDDDGIPDLVEGGGALIDAASVDTDGDGRIDDGLPTGTNGLLDKFETVPDSGVPNFPAADTDADGTADFRDADADADSANDVVEAGLADEDGDGTVDEAGARAALPLPDTDDDGVPDYRDADAVGTGGTATGGAAGGTTQGTGTDIDDTDDTDDTDVPADDDGREVDVRTGLDGGAGCGIASPRTATDPLFALLLAGAGACFVRRRRTGARREPARAGSSETTV